MSVAALALALTFLLAATASAGAKTVWLCKPGIAHDPCTRGLSTTSFTPDSKQIAVEHPKAAKHPSFDCFYVYPTISDQKTTLANRHVDPEERSIALYQAARYSQYCRVFAPMYRQVTLKTLFETGTETDAQLATGLGDVRAAFKDYLAHYNHGRGFVLIGHSQGSFVLDKLVAMDVDAKPAVRRRMLSAILLGGDVLVKQGSDVGGDFKHVRACRSATQLSCVIAFSTYDDTVPENSFFGRTTAPGKAVLCTNPASLAGGSGTADAIVPTEPFAPGATIGAGIALLDLKIPPANTTWVRFPNAYKAACSSAGGAHVLQITPQPGAQVPKASPNAQWGLHLLDANIGLGNLLGIVRSQAAAFAQRAQ